MVLDVMSRSNGTHWDFTTNKLIQKCTS